jgi:hypothetical protein
MGRGHEACFELLLSHGADPTEVQLGESPEYLIQLVLESGRQSLVQILTRRGFALEIARRQQRIEKGPYFYPQVVEVWRSWKTFVKTDST